MRNDRDAASVGNATLPDDHINSTDLTGALNTWQLVQGDIVATPPANVLNIVPAGARRFNAVEEFAAPPVAVFPENYDAVAAASLPAGWTDAAASSRSNCTGTNIASNDGVNTDIWLRAPAIDLTASPEGALVLKEFRDIENIPVIDLGSGIQRILRLTTSRNWPCSSLGLKARTMRGRIG